MNKRVTAAVCAWQGFLVLIATLASVLTPMRHPWDTFVGVYSVIGALSVGAIGVALLIIYAIEGSWPWSSNE